MMLTEMYYMMIISILQYVNSSHKQLRVRSYVSCVYGEVVTALF